MNEYEWVCGLLAFVYYYYECNFGLLVQTELWGKHKKKFSVGTDIHYLFIYFYIDLNLSIISSDKCKQTANQNFCDGQGGTGNHCV